MLSSCNKDIIIIVVVVVVIVEIVTVRALNPVKQMQMLTQDKFNTDLHCEKANKKKKKKKKGTIG